MIQCSRFKAVLYALRLILRAKPRRTQNTKRKRTPKKTAAVPSSGRGDRRGSGVHTTTFSYRTGQGLEGIVRTRAVAPVVVPRVNPHRQLPAGTRRQCRRPINRLQKKPHEQSQTKEGDMSNKRDTTAVEVWTSTFNCSTLMLPSNENTTGYRYSMAEAASKHNHSTI